MTASSNNERALTRPRIFSSFLEKKGAWETLTEIHCVVVAVEREPVGTFGLSPGSPRSRSCRAELKSGLPHFRCKAGVGNLDMFDKLKG